LVQQLFAVFELSDVFHSWWFSVVVLLLALNLTACSIQRLPQIWIDIHNPPKKLNDSLIERMLAKYVFQMSDLETAKKVVLENWLGNTPLEKRGDIYYGFHEKHRYGRTGVYVIHTALLMIMGGSIIATNLGVDGMMQIDEGSSKAYVDAKGPGGLTYSHPIGFSVACQDFTLKTFVDDSPMEYASVLAIYEPGQKEPVKQQIVKVNEPLDYKGYTFYQASYQPISSEKYVNLALASHGGVSKNFRVALNDKLKLENGHEVTAIEAYDDFGGLGQALKVEHVDPRGVTSRFTVFRQYPDFDAFVRRGSVDVVYHGLDQKYATGISVGKTPGLYVVWIGCVLMVVGLYMAFMMNHRRYYARIRPNENGFEVVVAGFCRRHIPSFLDEMNERSKRLQ
jgi:cytochrome c biogenesis protein